MERLQRGRQALVDQINEQQEEIRRLRSIVASREQLLSPPRRSIAVADAQTDVTAHDLDLMAMQLADKAGDPPGTSSRSRRSAWCSTCPSSVARTHVSGRRLKIQGLQTCE
mmetsp:Transcript_38772/g.84015  ORF Transcript_38772/g.84015 Transcript_38772/m.84015 type:complete len:111 (-) Transcript_38772:242-574(-)